jgi:hypothetical protein
VVICSIDNEIIISKLECLNSFIYIEVQCSFGSKIEAMHNRA